jgi:hypothetical protein
MSGVGFVIAGLAVGFLVGWFVAALGFQQLEAEARQLRAGLRYVRGVAFHHPDLRGLVRYIDNLLGDEAGA